MGFDYTLDAIIRICNDSFVMSRLAATILLCLACIGFGFAAGTHWGIFIQQVQHDGDMAIEAGTNREYHALKKLVWMDEVMHTPYVQKAQPAHRDSR